jgi:DNA-binding NarL/FixJ family response regulator
MERSLGGARVEQLLIRSDRQLRGTAASPDAVARSHWDDCRVRPTVLIVDDHAEFRQSAGALLEAEGFTVIGEAADGDAAIAAVERVRPQIVLLDVQLPGADGFAVAERLAAGRDPPVVVLISSREAAAYGPRLQAAAAHGFLPKRELSGAALAALVG